MNTAEVLAAVEKAKDRWPTLNKSGLWHPSMDDPRYRVFRFDEAKHMKSRADLTDRESIEEFRSAMAYLVYEGGPVLTDDVNRTTTSYGWKHAAELWARAHRYYPYVSNGIFLCAALAVGCRIEPIERSLNAFVNLSKLMQPSFKAFKKNVAGLHYKDALSYNYGSHRLDWPQRREVA